MYKRIVVIGCCGSGKSTLSREFQKITNLPLIHLDQEYWRPNWVEPTAQEWEPIVHELANRPSWIIDGNYGGTMEIRMKRADTIIFLDRPTWLCLFRVMKRVWQYHGKERPDMPEGCRERWDWGFLHYVATFNLVKRSSILRRIDKYRQNCHVFRLRNNRDVQQFLHKLRSLQH